VAQIILAGSRAAPAQSPNLDQAHRTPCGDVRRRHRRARGRLHRSVYSAGGAADFQRSYRLCVASAAARGSRPNRLGSAGSAARSRTPASPIGAVVYEKGAGASRHFWAGTEREQGRGRGQILRCTGLRDRPDSAPEPRRLDIFRPAPGPRRRRVGARNSWIVVGGRSVPSSLKSMIHPFGEEFPCSDFWRSNRNSEQV
jgi:hypothetical protein